MISDQGQCLSGMICRKNVCESTDVKITLNNLDVQHFIIDNQDLRILNIPAQIIGGFMPGMTRKAKPLTPSGTRSCRYHANDSRDEFWDTLGFHAIQPSC